MGITRSLERGFEAEVMGDDFVGPLGLLPYYQRGGEGPTDKPSFTSEYAGDYLTRPGWGPGAVVTYAFRATASFPMPGDTGGFSRFNAQQIAQAELALQSWSDVANITFVRVGDTGYSDNAQILFGNYSSGADGAAAFANYPGLGGGGDAWFNSTLSYNASPQLWNYGRTTLVHEIGHALGLSHPGDYDAGEGDPDYTNSAVYYEDSRQYTVMSYWSETNTGADFHGYYAAAPLLDDITAIQGVYGANMTTRTGDTVYGFNSNTGRDFYSVASGSAPVIFAVWDAGGFDTLDFSGYAQNQVIDLRQGAYSSVGGLVGNVAIATGAVIERAVGGSGADVMHAAATYVDDALPDLVKTQAQANTSLATAVSLSGAFDLATDPRIGASTTIPHATVTAVGAGAGQEYYVFTVSSGGVTATFDIDGTAYGFDSFIRIYDANGVQVASNDDGRGPGWTDSRMTYLFAAPGTYYVSVDRYGGGGVPAGAPYTLHVSLPGAVPPSLRPVLGSTLEGRGGDDSLTGDAAADILDGGTGNDLLVGGAGDDLLIGGDGNDLLQGDGGTDTASYASAAAGVNVNLAITTAQATGGAGTDTLAGVERLIGSAFADTLRGDASDNTLTGGAGDDALYGGTGNDLLEGGLGNDRLEGEGGNDTATYAAATAGVTVDLRTSAAQSTGGAGTDTLVGVENLIGSAFADWLTGGAGTNVLTGGDGDDHLEGGGQGDSLDGGNGFDEARFVTASSAVNVNLTTGVHTGDAAGDTFVSIERFVLSGYADQFTGSAGADDVAGYSGNDTLFGAAGDDKLDGGSGNDILRGGLGADRLIGGDGTDQANYQIATAAVTVNLTTGVHTGEAAGDTFDSIERFVLTGYGDQFAGAASADEAVGYYGNDILFGAAGDDKLDGGNGNDILRGGEGADQLIGGTGTDTASYQVATAAVSLNLTTGVHTGEAAGDTYDGIERYALSTLDDSFIGSAGADWVDGWKGNDVLRGEGGNDEMFGNEGNDQVFGGSGNDVLHGDGGVDVLYGDAGADVLYGGTGADQLLGGDDGDFLWGEAGNDTLTGGAGADRFAFSTGSGVDVITDFQRGQDKIILKGMAGIDDFSDVRISADSHGWAVITWGDGTSTVTLSGIAAAQVTSSDIWFTG